MNTIDEIDEIEEATCGISEDAEEILNLLENGKAPNDPVTYLRKINKVAKLIKRAYEELAEA